MLTSIFANNSRVSASKTREKKRARRTRRFFPRGWCDITMCRWNDKRPTASEKGVDGDRYTVVYGTKKGRPVVASSRGHRSVPAVQDVIVREVRIFVRSGAGWLIQPEPKTV